MVGELAQFGERHGQQVDLLDGGVRAPANRVDQLIAQELRVPRGGGGGAGAGRGRDGGQHWRRRGFRAAREGRVIQPEQRQVVAAIVRRP